MVEPAPTRDHTERMLEPAGARVSDGRAARPCGRRSGSTLGRGRGAGGLLLGSAVHRRRDARSRLRAPRPRRQPQPAPNGPARPARAHGRARHRLQPPPIGGEPAGDLDVRYAELVGADVGPRTFRPRSTSCRCSLCGRGRARGDSVLRGAGELRAKETDRLDAVVEGLRGLGAHISGRPTASGCAGCRRGCGAARWTAAATIGSRCWPRSPGSPRGRASASRVPTPWPLLPAASSTSLRARACQLAPAPRTNR